ncbi:MAG: DUF2480 family protein [Chitinophagales bacterium]|nr:DUF2480 family protein [Bacteroidota bacterium]MCB9043939.1 DUF2480 family protein [Chitinophagales bacterium]
MTPSFSETSSPTLHNKVAESGLILIDLENFFPPETQLASFDFADYLFRNAILREKDLREALKTMDWQVYAQKYVGIFCSADALIPMWAYMLVSTHLCQVGAYAFVVSKAEEIGDKALLVAISQHLNAAQYAKAKVIIKGCGKKTVPAEAYVLASNLLQPHVHSLMFGEACSTVPVYKIKKPAN